MRRSKREQAKDVKIKLDGATCAKDGIHRDSRSTSSTRGRHADRNQDTGNKISRKSLIEGKSNIMLGGKTVIMAGAVVRGDLCKIPERSADGATDKTATTAITVGR